MPSKIPTSDHETELDAFVYHISHDVRASVRALTVVPSWIEEDLKSEVGTVPEPIKQHLEMLTSHARRLDQMMVDLLLYSRVGRMQNERDVDIGACIDATLAAQPESTSVQVTREIDVPTIHGGETDIRTLVEVLVSNAIRHSAGDNTHVMISTRRTGDGIELAVADNGPGIAEQYHDRIFEVMTTLKPRDEVEGSGMGLAVARKIMAHHNGRITVQSDPDAGGAVFTATFPAR